MNSLILFEELGLYFLPIHTSPTKFRKYSFHSTSIFFLFVRIFCVCLGLTFLFYTLIRSHVIRYSSCLLYRGIKQMGRLINQVCKNRPENPLHVALEKGKWHFLTSANSPIRSQIYIGSRLGRFALAQPSASLLARSLNHGTSCSISPSWNDCY